MSEEYVHKDTFDEALKRIELLVDANTNIMRKHQVVADAQHERVLAEIRGEVQALREKIDGNGNVLAAYIQFFSAKSAFWQGVLGLVIGLSAIVVAAVQVFLAFRG